ncbi:hypothetical protein DNTS_014811 [Danionella cerebrum]|uniref:G-protein coupled receptors family 2 profile 1 domain-containing protein n=1 Tax=Danionella cerebrum TaxID=2873325 RepID=A0A553PWW0_9TELE|nr:hypothetical protein DNTS_014811 [Danionella translucida]
MGSGARTHPSPDWLQTAVTRAEGAFVIREDQTVSSWQGYTLIANLTFGKLYLCHIQTMDASLFQFFLEEFGDPNCTLLDAFQLSLYGNSSFALMNVDGVYCNATTDEIGTCWPRSNSGRIIERPCPEYINGVKYNTTSEYHATFASRYRGASKFLFKT